MKDKHLNILTILLLILSLLKGYILYDLLQEKRDIPIILPYRSEDLDPPGPPGGRGHHHPSMGSPPRHAPVPGDPSSMQVHQDSPSEMHPPEAREGHFPRPPLPPHGHRPPMRDLPLDMIITTDDVIRGLNILYEEEGEFQLTPQQKEKLLPLVKKAAEGKERIHNLRKEEELLQYSVMKKTADLFMALTPDQRAYIRSNRDEVERILTDFPRLRRELKGE